MLLHRGTAEPQTVERLAGGGSRVGRLVEVHLPLQGDLIEGMPAHDDGIWRVGGSDEAGSASEGGFDVRVVPVWQNARPPPTRVSLGSCALGAITTPVGFRSESN